MSVLLLSGKPVDWAKPPKATTRVKWSRKDMYGRDVTGSLRTIAALDRTDALAVKRWGVHIVVIQPPFNKGVAASAGTHDYDACLDVYIPGVAWRIQESFFRANGWGAYWRRPPKFGHHIHMFVLPVQEGVDRTDDYREGGFKVGRFVDGGWSLFGRRTTSAQVGAYYEHRDALASNAKDDGWFPASIKATIFNLGAYLKSQVPVRTRVTSIRTTHLNIPGPGVGTGKDLGNDAARAKAAAKLVGNNNHIITWNELGPRQQSKLGSKFSLLVDKAIGAKYRLIVPTKAYNENYISSSTKSITLLQQYDDVVLVAKKGSGNKHLTLAKFKHANGLVFLAGVYHLPPGKTAANESDRQEMARQARVVTESLAGDLPYFLSGDVNTPKDLTALTGAGLKRTRKWADKSDGAKATYTNYEKEVPSTNAAEWEIDATYSKGFYVVVYKVLRLLRLGKYIKPRPSDHDAIQSVLKVRHTY